MSLRLVASVCGIVALALELKNVSVSSFTVLRKGVPFNQLDALRRSDECHTQTPKDEV